MDLWCRGHQCEGHEYLLTCVCPPHLRVPSVSLWLHVAYIVVECQGVGGSGWCCCIQSGCPRHKRVVWLQLVYISKQISTQNLHTTHKTTSLIIIDGAEVRE